MQKNLNLNYFISYFLVPLFLFTGGLLASKHHTSPKAPEPVINLVINQESEQSASLILSIELAPEQAIYADSLDLSLDQPELLLTGLQNSKPAQISHDPKLNGVSVLTGKFNITGNLQIAGPTKSHAHQSPANLHLSYLLVGQKRANEKIFPVNLFNAQAKQALTSQTAEHTSQEISKKVNSSQDRTNLSKSSFWQKVTSFSAWLQEALRTSESLSFKLILVFLLGLLMSLTPCIYPMIPITAGVLQAQNSNSIGRSFILAFTYTLGTSTTFAVFGLVAALTGHLFGQLLVNPIFIVVIIVILAYLGLSMFGLYDMYVPKFMSQENNFTQKKSSLLSIFIFGAISGSMASPCLSPGLALLLSIVATLGNNFLGFVMLFIFGLGLSVPLLIIGTFSNSINIIPQSGNWMVEIKKFFGFLLLAMCIYLLSNILPDYVIAWIVALFVFGAGVYYLQNGSSSDTTGWRYFKNSLGGLLIICSILLSAQAIYQTYFPQAPSCENSAWHTNYESALKLAHANNQKLLIDCGADWCSICKAIDKYVLNDPQVKAALCNLVLLKVDATDQASEPYVTLKNKYQIFGVPAILLVEPKDQALIKKWGSDLYDLPKQEFIDYLQ